MAVPGRKLSTNLKCTTITCQPCKDDGNIVKAKGYCEDCNEFVCKSCTKAHRKLSWTKDHVIKSKDEIPAFLFHSSPCTEYCNIHKTDIVKLYCKEHDSVGCKLCMEDQHSSCNIKLVAYVSRNYSDSDEFVGIMQKIQCMRKSISFFQEKLNYCMKTAEEIKEEVVREIKHFRKEVEDYLDITEADLIRKVDEMNTNIVSKQQELQNQSKGLNNELEEFQNKLDQCQGNANDLFVTSKLLIRRLQKCQEINDDISLQSQVQILQFSPSGDIHKLISNKDCFGNITTRNKESITNMAIQFHGNMNVQAENEENCYIAGMSTISQDEIICADSKNGSVKILDLQNGKITSTLKTSSFPADVTAINNSCAAATLPTEGKILFLNTHNGLTISHSLNVREGCWGNDYHNGKMAVSFVKPSAVQVLDMEGHILHELIDTGVLIRPVRLALSSRRIYVSDSFSDAVYEFTINGQLRNTIKSAEMTLPAGITYTSCGSAVVCYSNEKKVGIVVQGTTEILPAKLQNAIMPYSILICKEKGRMYISEIDKSQDCNLIKIYDLK